MFDFKHMPKKTFIAFCLFLIAKLTGFCGVILGFSPPHRDVAGSLLVCAIVSIFISITLCIFQMRQDKAFQEEENIVVKLQRKKRFLIQEIKDLEKAHHGFFK